MVYRNPKALGCSVPSAARALLRARGFLSTQPNIIGLDSMLTAVRHRIENGMELESSTYGLVPTLGLHIDSSCKADTVHLGLPQLNVPIL